MVQVPSWPNFVISDICWRMRRVLSGLPPKSVSLVAARLSNVVGRAPFRRETDLGVNHRAFRKFVGRQYLTFPHPPFLLPPLYHHVALPQVHRRGDRTAMRAVEEWMSR